MDVGGKEENEQKMAYYIAKPIGGNGDLPV